MNLAITRQRNLMKDAIRYYDDIRAIQRNFNIEDAIIQLKIEILQQQYAETVTELAKLLMETIPS
jgi:hypothetical protein